jgi:aminoglycoside N3'-acetyltransferase
MKPSGIALIEFFARQARWRWPLRELLGRKAVLARTTGRYRITREHLERTFELANLSSDDTVMIHSRTSGLVLVDGASEVSDPIAVAEMLLRWIKEVVGPRVTLVMPTYPFYLGKSSEKNCPDQIRRYDPLRTVTKSGLLPELFRRSTGALRSSFPLQSLTAIGPLADFIIRPEKIVNEQPPHGVDSPHYRVCERNALIVGLGLKLTKFLTAIHVSEDLRFDFFKSRNFYRRRNFLVNIDRVYEVTMWERRPELVRVICCEQVARDLRQGNALCESADGESFDRCRAGDMLEIMKGNCNGLTYPYLWPLLAGPFRDK